MGLAFYLLSHRGKAPTCSRRGNRLLSWSFPTPLILYGKWNYLFHFLYILTKLFVSFRFGREESVD